MLSFVDKGIILTFVLASLSGTIFSQNLISDPGFEKADNESLVDFNVALSNGSFRIAQDSINGGKQCLCIEKPEIDSSSSAIFKTFNSDYIVGSELTLSVFLKSSSIIDGCSGVFVNQFDATNKVIGNKFLEPEICDPGKWEEYELNVPVDDLTRIISIGFYIYGKGEICVDKVSLSSRANAAVHQITENELEFFKGFVSPLENSTDFVIDLLGADIIGLGENTHGSSTVQKIRFRLIDKLNEQSDLQLVFEDDRITVPKINECLYGEDECDVLGRMKFNFYPLYVTEDYLTFFKEIREDYQRTKKKIKISGMDVQGVKESQKFVEEFLSREEGHQPLFMKFRNNLDLIRYEKGKEDYKLRQNRNVVKVLNVLNQLEASVGESPFADEKLTFHIDHIRQYINSTNNVRDSVMAQNVMRLRGDGTTKLVVLAHDEHVGKAGTRMGRYLNEKYGDGYVSIGFLIREGNYWGHGKDGNSTYSLDEVMKGGLESNIGNLGYDQCVINLKMIRASSDPRLDWIKGKVMYRNIGLGGQGGQFNYGEIIDKFDYLIYIKKSNAASNLFYKN